MQATRYMLGLLLGLIAVGAAAPAVMMMNGAINGYAHTTRMDTPSEHMDHHAEPIVREGTCCSDQNRTMNRARDQYGRMSTGIL